MAPTHSPRSTSAPPHFYPAWHPQGRSGLRDMCTDPALHQASTAKAGHLAKPAAHGPKNRHPVRDTCVHYRTFHQASTTKIGHLPQQLYTDPNSSVPFGTPFFTPETGVHGQQNQRPFGTPFYTQTSTARAGHLPKQLCTDEQAASLRDTYPPQHSSPQSEHSKAGKQFSKALLQPWPLLWQKPSPSVQTWLLLLLQP